MKSLLTICLAGLAAAAFAAETAVDLSRKGSFLTWAPPSYYQTKPTVTVENGIAKVVCGELVEGAKPNRYQFHVRPQMTFKAGVKYTITFTVKSSEAVAKGKWLAGFMLGQKPYTIYTQEKVALAANEKQTITLTYTPAEDITGPTCAPTVQLILQKGQTLEIGDVKIVEE